ncbi:putative thiazole-containing bacteriocin maturation protein [Alteribacillus bidgolensis]|uniref:Putative thiazole-containing bacteriocin maturation protein n=1 Tax=Alteribacillus bidgolensis TaxID=930129 RepID=A0A1G8QI76_9BACI|nr:putative thiazole-containing bacteriocin maturation protein [Alteribacillus bidgolensis]SDJ04371.1 putative thiazole-containing bacteriocin maturation protein [Alteribacillus bidgolensis]
MTKLTPSMRLKVKRDTFFLPESNSGGVYFRNNESSFRMEGSMIDQWVEKLLPMFNGEHSLGEMTDRLPIPHRDRVFEIAEVLYQNGFVRDVSQDRPHQLKEQILKTYASQIEFLNSFGDSGAYRFQLYRQSKVLAVGTGTFLVSLVSALIESGLPKIHMFNTDPEQSNKQRLKELVEHARQRDPEVEIEEVSLSNGGENSWQKLIKPFHTILYVAQGEAEQLQKLHKVCREEKKVFLPALCLQQVGMAGPLVHPDSNGCWDSAWRSIHQYVLSKENQLFTTSSSTALAMLANVIVFEWFKMVTDLKESGQKNQFFLLNLETLEGNWHLFSPHPLVSGRAEAKWVQDFEHREKNVSKTESNELLLYFNELTSKESGIFHIWEEGNLKQLPLAQCRVQSVDPLSEGPAELLPDIICTGLTHTEVRKEAGLTGVEMYGSRIADRLAMSLPPESDVKGSLIQTNLFVGVGAGETFSEGVCRGLNKCLVDELKKQVNQKYIVSPVQLSAVEDERCQFYLQALTTMEGNPVLGMGKNVHGFPVVWVGTNKSWYASPGLSITMALRHTLQGALLKAQNKEDCQADQVLEISSVVLDDIKPEHIKITEETRSSEMLHSSKQVLEQNHMRFLVFELELEPFLKTPLAGVFGVLLREEESR